ncbi:lipoate--protein ligase family protein [Syntrophothermus lipocalidus]|uniref:Biotin/lipoate A/B protein ligase n=1 Tax=Syntrophothermus lipocalidus (strain DSM 12680 / TGB-C1) TaxID=643648 RepID=D7CJG9_SYNLT|nr:lipoate--protein ligase family protein [Syntrophothermus lipocalidus]ADI02924.1 biotin/lipoate A/B protein ligase [Syntrophothermus lipocalidus DSM 12680]
MSKQWRLIRSGAGEPAWNMAVDEALAVLHSKEEGRPPVLRLYTWEPPALSLGYFQDVGEVDLAALKRLGIVPVKRITGGRAVLHYGDLTYTVVATAGKDAPEGVISSYRYLCQGLLQAFADLGIKAELGRAKPSSGWSEACFATATTSDITWHGKKFVGSAQKRLGRTLLQHGSILVFPQDQLLNEVFACEEEAKCRALLESVTCLQSILAKTLTLGEVAEAVIRGFSRALGIQFEEDELNDEERNLAASLVPKYELLPILSKF